MSRIVLLLGFACLPSVFSFAVPTSPRRALDGARYGALGPAGHAEKTCADCHAQIHAEWKSSLHGQAWERENYQRALKRRRVTQRDACWPCHVPQPLLAERLALDASGLPAEPVARTEDLHLGIDCATCHLAPDGAMLGPFGGATAAHASRRDARFEPAAVDRLCLACHATEIGPVLPLGKDFLAAPPREPMTSCVGCHMAPVERAMASSEGAEPAPIRRGRSHALRGARDAELLATTIEFRATRRPDGKIEVALSNAGAAHRTPGLVGRVWSFDLECSSAESPAGPGAKRGAKPVKQRFEIRHEEALHAGASRSVILDPSGLEGPLVLRIRARYALDAKESIELPERVIALP